MSPFNTFREKEVNIIKFVKGDGVERAFVSSKRVFCLSFHQWECGYYPGTGSVKDMGCDKGKGYSANFPYKRGIMGDKYIKYFKR